jgi:mono/diheme cytochrome c family protein
LQEKFGRGKRGKEVNGLSSLCLRVRFYKTCLICRRCILHVTAFTMKRLHKPASLLLPLLLLFSVYPFNVADAPGEIFSPTPTYDPLVEPPLPEHPTELALGRNLYWHWCMTCHGDRGQGLTDEFRAVWEPEHQNCWARGCHAGRSGDGGFPIPTVVPALVDETYLARYPSVQELADFLKATHPPQSPGILKSDEYHAIALFVFGLNQRPTIELPATNTPAPTFIPTSTLMPQKPISDSLPAYLALICSVLIIGVLGLARRTNLQG